MHGFWLISGFKREEAVRKVRPPTQCFIQERAKIWGYWRTLVRRFKDEVVLALYVFLTACRNSMRLQDDLLDYGLWAVQPSIWDLEGWRGNEGKWLLQWKIWPEGVMDLSVRIRWLESSRVPYLISQIAKFLFSGLSVSLCASEYSGVGREGFKSYSKLTVLAGDAHSCLSSSRGCRNA